MTQDALLFEVDQKRFGLWANHVKQLIRAVAITSLPGAPKSIEGVINYHGTIVPVLNFRGLFRLPPKDLELSDNLIILQTSDAELAIRVDKAVDLIQLEDEAISETQFTIEGNSYTRTIGKTALGLICLIEIEQLLSCDDFQKLNEYLAARTDQLLAGGSP